MTVSERESVKRCIAWRLVGAFPTGEQTEAVWGALDAMDDDSIGGDARKH